MKKIDLRSDNIADATAEMVSAMTKAATGDAVLGEDPSVKNLEELGASILGMEAGLFLPSGTMANQVAIMALTERGQEVIISKESHIYNLEVAGLAALSQVQVRAIETPKGFYDPEIICQAIQSEGIQKPVTGAVCVENTHNLYEGRVVTIDNMKKIYEVVKKYEIPIYLDGARIFNAASFLEVKPCELCKHVDAVQICLTKGLCAPIGSILCGKTKFISKAKKLAQRIGGGMRKAGYMAAAGIVGLETMV